MTYPYFSIVTPTLNIAKYLPRMLKSVEFQEYRGFEHIFIDSYSTDGTFELLQEYKKRNKDIIIKIIQEPAQGVFTGFNQGIKIANGKFINFLNADDYYINANVLKSVYRITKLNPNIKWLQGDSTIEKHYQTHIKNKYTGPVLFHLGMSFLCPISHQSTFMTKDLLEKYDGFKTRRKEGMDTDLFLRMSKEEEIYFFDQQLSVFTIREDSISRFANFDSFYSNWKDFYIHNHTVPLLSGIVNTFTKAHLRKSVSLKK